MERFEPEYYYGDVPNFEPMFPDKEAPKFEPILTGGLSTETERENKEPFFINQTGTGLSVRPSERPFRRKLLRSGRFYS